MKMITTSSSEASYLPILSSQAQVWDNVLVEQFQHPPGEEKNHFSDSLFFQITQEYSATTTRLAFLPFVMANLIAPTFSSWLTARIGSRTPMASGLMLTGMGSLILASVHQNTDLCS